MSYPQLSGRPGPINEGQPGRTVLLAVVALAAVLAALTWHWFPSAKPAASATTIPANAVAQSTVTAPAAIPVPPFTTPGSNATEDQRLHLEHAAQTLLTAAEQLATARRLLAALSPDLGRSYLQYEKRRADSAWTSCDTAARAIEEARDDIKVVASKGKD